METSPPTWGKPYGPEPGVKVFRNIPTYVGKTVKDSLGTVTTRETSPPTWGKLGSTMERSMDCRNIPTYVGKTCRRTCRTCRCRKHPHLRGENETSSRIARVSSETSPPTWGKQKATELNRKTVRNIPTYVGKTARFCLDCHYGYYILLKSKFLALSLRQGCAIFAYHPSLGIDLRLAEALRDVPNDCGGRVIKGRLLPN